MITTAARARRRVGTAASVFIALAGLYSFIPTLPPVRAQAQDAAAPQNAKIWIDNRQAIEEYLRNAEVVKVEAIGVGVTSPRRAYLAPGGPFDSFTWKPIKPGRYNGFWESYKSEIAAYELDKFLKIDMMPPAVERKVDGVVGAAVMWASPVKSFKQLGGVPSPPAALMQTHLSGTHPQMVSADQAEERQVVYLVIFGAGNSRTTWTFGLRLPSKECGGKCQ